LRLRIPAQFVSRTSFTLHTSIAGHVRQGGVIWWVVIELPFSRHERFAGPVDMTLRLDNAGALPDMSTAKEQQKLSRDLIMAVQGQAASRAS
jgi:hypothetical protein